MIDVYFTWQTVELVRPDGEIVRTQVMIPLARFANVCAAQYQEGATYRMEVEQVTGERTDASHRHFMASVTQAWRNLPEKMAAEYPTAEHLRKRALIKTGHYHLESKVFDTPTDAIKAAAFLKPLDDYAVVLVKGNVVNHFRAKSQKYLRSGGMGKEEFQKSKDDVLSLLADFIGTSKAQLVKEGKKEPA